MQTEDLLETSDMVLRLVEVLLEPVSQLLIVGFLNHSGQGGSYTLSA